MQVLRIPAGIGNASFFNVRKETMCDFYSYIVGNTINLLLTVKI